MKIVTAIVLIAAVGGVYELVYNTGGIKYVCSHTMYIPILLTGFIFGASGGFIIAIVAGFLLGPLMPLEVATGEEQSTFNWLFRTGIFIIAGTLSGTASTVVKQYIQQLNWISSHDIFTNLPNRLALRRKLTHVVNHLKDSECITFAIVAIENKSELTSTFGPTVLEEAIKQLAQKLQLPLACKWIFHPETSSLGLLIKSDSDYAVALQKELENISRMSISFRGLSLHVDTRIGISQSCDMKQTATEYYKQAKMALATAQLKNIDSAIYKPYFTIATEENLTLLGNLGKAINNDELSLHFQPKINIATGLVCGAEALIRWNHPQLGNIPPGSFIPRAEESTLIHSITEFALKNAMATINQWRRNNISIPIAVNISTRNLSQSNFCELINQLMDQYGVKGEELELEITESALLLDFEHALSELLKLNSMKITITIDDFGTGYSSLQYVHCLPVSIIKIDQSFIRRIHTEKEVIPIVEATVKMANNLGLKVVAEGVESPEAYRILSDVGCDMAQGFLISRPMPNTDFMDWYNNNNGFFSYTCDDYIKKPTKTKLRESATPYIATMIR